LKTNNQNFNHPNCGLIVGLLLILISLFNTTKAENNRDTLTHLSTIKLGANFLKNTNFSKKKHLKIFDSINNLAFEFNAQNGHVYFFYKKSVMVQNDTSYLIRRGYKIYNDTSLLAIFSQDIFIDYSPKPKMNIQVESEWEEITLVGVSHGGNVSIRAARILGKMGYKANVITLNTPASKNADDSEGPKDNPGINDMIDIRTQGDFVPGLPFGKTWNYDEKVTRQSLTITSKEKGSDKHATKNTDTEQIKDSGLGKLNPVEPVCTPPAQIKN
jgi:hypothetical protein